MKISTPLLTQIHAHVQAGYPNEACGLILGRNGVATEIVAANNQRTDSSHNRYLIDPRTYLEVERDADRRGLEVLGIYHSHPDAAAEPSQFDLDNAWPDLSYLIVAVARGKTAETRCWRLNESHRRFMPEPLHLL